MLPNDGRSVSCLGKAFSASFLNTTGRRTQSSKESRHKDNPSTPFSPSTAPINTQGSQAKVASVPISSSPQLRCGSLVFHLLLVPYFKLSYLRRPGSSPPPPPLSAQPHTSAAFLCCGSVYPAVICLLTWRTPPLNQTHIRPV